MSNFFFCQNDFNYFKMILLSIFSPRYFWNGLLQMFCMRERDITYNYCETLRWCKRILNRQTRLQRILTLCKLLNIREQNLNVTTFCLKIETFASWLFTLHGFENHFAQLFLELTLKSVTFRSVYMLRMWFWVLAADTWYIRLYGNEQWLTRSNRALLHDVFSMYVGPSVVS